MNHEHECGCRSRIRSEDKVVAIIVICVFLAFLSLVSGIVGYNMYATHKFVEGGYHECMLAGSSSSPKWCK